MQFPLYNIDGPTDKCAMTKQHQLILNFNFPDDATFENFYPGEANQKVFKLLEELPKNAHNQFIYLWGPNGVGRSHLLMASCNSFDKAHRLAYLSLRDQDKVLPSILENFENMTLLCLDDLDAIAGNRIWEEAIFHCFNRISEAKGNLLVAANASPSALPFTLPDLKSRLSSLTVFQLHTLTDEQKLHALNFRAQKRGLSLNEDTANYLLNHYQRDIKALFAMLEKLAKEALHAKRALTIPFVKSVLEKHENT